VEEPKRIPPTKKWLRKLSPTPFVPMVTVKAGGHEIEACVGFELFLALSCNPVLWYNAALNEGRNS